MGRDCQKNDEGISKGVEAKSGLESVKEKTQRGLVVTYLVVDYRISIRDTKRHIFTYIKEIYVDLYCWPQANVYAFKDVGKLPCDMEEPQFLETQTTEPSITTKTSSPSTSRVIGGIR